MSYIANRAIHEQEWGATNFTRVLRLLLLFVEKKEKRVSLLRELLSEHRELQSENTTITPTIKGEHKGDYTVFFHFTPSLH